MINFTIEELIALEDAMQERLRTHRPMDGESPLLNKLQHMINWLRGMEIFYPSDEWQPTKCCDHVIGNEIILSNPPKAKCAKCGDFVECNIYMSSGERDE